VSYKYIYIHYIDVFRWRAHLYSGSALQKYDPKIVNGLSVFTARDAGFGSKPCSRGSSGRALFRVAAHDRNNVSSRSIIGAAFPREIYCFSLLLPPKIYHAQISSSISRISLTSLVTQSGRGSLRRARLPSHLRPSQSMREDALISEYK
jgi:hypothetical protein